MAKIKDNTAAFLGEEDRLISKILGQAALLVERTTKQPGYCPVRTGTARRSIISNWYKSGSTRSVPAGNRETTISSQTDKRAVIGSNIDYFPYIEIGTSRMAARAPLRRALAANKNVISQLFKSSGIVK